MDDGWADSEYFDALDHLAAADGLAKLVESLNRNEEADHGNT